MNRIGKIGLAALAIGLAVTAWPFVMPCGVMPGGRCGDGQALLIFPFLGLPIAALGLLTLVGNLLKRLLQSEHSITEDRETEF